MSDILDKLRGLKKQATEERSHHYVASVVDEVIAEIEQRDKSFDLRWKAQMRAIKRWQAAHPDQQDIWPDHADLVVWLMEQWDEDAGAHISAKRAAELFHGRKR